MQIKNAIYQGTISGKQVVVDHERLKYNKFLILPVIVGIIFIYLAMVVMVIIINLAFLVDLVFINILGCIVGFFIPAILFKYLHNQIFMREITLIQLGWDQYELHVGNQKYIGYYKDVKKAIYVSYPGQATIFMPDAVTKIKTSDGTYRIAAVKMEQQQTVQKIKFHFEQMIDKHQS